jgi:hypothetical protein
MATNGITLITPTSVAVTGAGSSATINAGGSVTFATAATLSLNGVFSSLYDNYVIDCRLKTDKGSKEDIRIRMRLSGTDNTTASSYVSQRLRADSTTVNGARTTADYGLIMNTETDVNAEGFTGYVYGPSLAQPTAWRCVVVNADSSAGIDDYAGTHNQSTAYDGFTCIYSPTHFTGLIKVYGLVQ